MAEPSQPWQLPAGGLVQAIRNRAERRQLAVYKVVPADLMRRYERATRAGHVSIDTAELLCTRVRLDIGLLYEPETLELARKAFEARRRPNAAKQHWMTRMTLADYQRIYDAMTAAADGDQFTGVLHGLIENLDVPCSYGAVIRVMQTCGWIRVEQRGHGGPRPRPSIVTLLARPTAERWPCANPACTQTITSVTADGTLTTGKLVYCSASCDNAVHAQALGRKLDNLRREAGLELTGKGRLNGREADAILRLIGKLRRST